MCGGRGSVISGLVILLALYDGNVERVRAACSRSKAFVHSQGVRVHLEVHMTLSIQQDDRFDVESRFVVGPPFSLLPLHPEESDQPPRCLVERSIDSLSLRSSTKKMYWIIIGLGLVLHSLDTTL
jgi:hypothetical protein